MTFLLDTDHVSLDQRGHPIVRARVQAAGSAQVTVSVITVEEQMRGWLAAIRAATTPKARAAAYQRLRMAVEYFASFAVVDYRTPASRSNVSTHVAAASRSGGSAG